MKFRPALFLLIWAAQWLPHGARANENYLDYHARTIEAEEHITRALYTQALKTYDSLFEDYGFAFLRDIKIATQLALQTHNQEKAFAYLRKGIASGWKMKEIKKNQFLDALRQDGRWQEIRTDYDSLRSVYLQSINPELRNEVHAMFKKDQGKAWRVLLAWGNRNRYIVRKFAPHSQMQLSHFEKIINRYGYAGERLIGNSSWMETILSHHNSMTITLTRQDTLYPRLRPRLLRAIELGQMSPYEFAIIDNWYIAIKSDHGESSYGNLEGTLETGAELDRANAMRKSIGLRRVETRNRLIDVQRKTGMNFYLPARPAPNTSIEIKSR